MHTLITGANRGIGAMLADQLQYDGWDVTKAARQGGDIQLDVTNPADHAAMAETLNGKKIDLLICNAGVYLEKGLSPEAYTIDMWAESFAVNVTGVFLTVRTLLPNLQSGSKIALLSSRMASHMRAPGGSYIYRSSKAAALNLGRNLATDLKPCGVAVGIYHPGWVRTEMGGKEAEIDVTQSAQGLIREFGRLDMLSTGCFRTWDGQDHPY